MAGSIAYYNVIAPSYENLYRAEQLEKVTSILKEVKVEPDNSVLDIGAGTGILEEVLVGCRITALEPSVLADFLKGKKLENVKIIRSSIEAFKTKEKFDRVFCITVLQDMDQKQRVICIKRAFELCKEGGYLAFSFLAVSDIDLEALHPILVFNTANDKAYIFKKEAEFKQDYIDSIGKL